MFHQDGLPNSSNSYHFARSVMYSDSMKSFAGTKHACTQCIDTPTFFTKRQGRQLGPSNNIFNRYGLNIHHDVGLYQCSIILQLCCNIIAYVNKDTTNFHVFFGGGGGGGGGGDSLPPV